MVRRVADTLTGDLFAAIPQQVPHNPGAWRFRSEIAHAMSIAVKQCSKDRYQIAADMSRLLGREVSVRTLDKYTSAAAEDHIPNFETAIAFDAATEQLTLVSLFAEKLGCKVLPGSDFLLAELGRLGQIRSDASAQEKAIKKYLKGITR